MGSFADQCQAISDPESLRRNGLRILVIGICFFLWSVFVYFQAIESRYWPSVSGIVVYSDASPSKGPDDEISGRFQYEYSVQNHLYKGTTVFFGQNMDDISTLEKYPIGSEVRVFYSPKNPTISLLEPGLRPRSYWMFFSSISITILGFGMIKAGDYLIRRRQQN